MSNTHTYYFGNGEADGSAEMRNLLGGKGANIAEMTRLGIPVPPGFTITTEVCTYFMRHQESFPDGLTQEVKEKIARLEKAMGSGFGDEKNPLLVSVRSGSRVSMPGMMDTVLNLGLNDKTVEGLAERTGNARFAFDSYRRFVQMYGNVVMGVPIEGFEEALAHKRKKAGVKLDNELAESHLRELTEEYKKIIKEEKGTGFPQDAFDQLWGAVAAVFNSWNAARAVSYRRMHDYPDDWGTAVNVQAMVFGNMGNDCATGVAFTRDPSTGERKFFGEFLVNAQGEDVVAGIRTPQHINGSDDSLEKVMPAAYDELVKVYQRIESHYRDMQDIEFTIQSGKLWMLQTRSGKRTGAAAIRIAVEMVDEGLIDKKTAIGRVEPWQVEQLLHPMLDPSVDARPFAHGLPASPGAASGRIAFTVEKALEMTGAGDEVILVRTETSPEDIEGMKVARAIVTSRGGMTSHAAVVARGMGTCCVAGCGDIEIDYGRGHFTAHGAVFKEGDVITVEGTSGNIYEGRLPTVASQLDDNFKQFMGWADECRRMKVRANADTPEDASNARRLGAVGIGLCRTEHMFFGEDRIDVMRRMIIADSREKRVEALQEILPMQRDDFVGVFRAMDGYPVTVRLLDPPLHEFVPSEPAEIKMLAERLHADVDALTSKINSLREFNPMLGHRGCRLGITYPEIYEVQVRAIIEAACIVSAEGVSVLPEIMVPLIGSRSELAWMRELIVKVAERTLVERATKIEYLVGTMIEVPRAALTADEVAECSDFFSFGTNDLTQMTYGFSRDDSARFIATYVTEGLLAADPFETIDVVGVGGLVDHACKLGRSCKPDLKIGVCGEHGGDPESVKFFDSIGLEYVSCSPFRVPVARLAAAQAALAKTQHENKAVKVGS